MVAWWRGRLMIKRGSHERPGPGFDWDEELTAESLERHLREGRIPVDGSCGMADLPRVSAAVVGADGPITWHLDAAIEPVAARPASRIWRLAARAHLICVCERCLGPVTIPLELHRGFVFMSASEADAFHARGEMGEDADGDDQNNDDVDAIAPEDRQSLRDILEDELLLSVPMAPKHPDCSLPSGSPERNGDMSIRLSAEDQPRSFAGLKDLLKKS
jgi:uncharacterized protein